MTESDIKLLCGDIFRALPGKKLKEAFSLIRKLVGETRQGEYADLLYNLEETYSFIRKYTLDGIKDPERDKIYTHLVRSVFELTVRIRESWMSEHAGALFYQRKRSGDYTLLRDPELYLKRLREQKPSSSFFGNREGGEEETPMTSAYWHEVVGVFYGIALTGEWNEDDRDFLISLLENAAVTPVAAPVWVTALTISLLRYFDDAKLEMLLDLCEAHRDRPVVSQRCLTGFLIGCFFYAPMLEFYPHIMTRFEIMNEEPAFYRQVERIILQLLGSRETEKIKLKIQEEIIPEMIRISPNIRNKFNIDHLMKPESDDDRNPEWSSLFDESPGLMDKMEEMARMQSEGADVFLASFGMFKTFPFFHELVNWFVPFFPGHPEMPLRQAGDPDNTASRIIQALLQSPMLCNSDKYSFAMMLQSITGEARSMMADFLQAEMEQSEEVIKEEVMLSPDRQEGIVSNRYIQDLYRFFRLFPFNHGLVDVFSLKFNFHNLPLFRGILEEHPSLAEKLAEFYFEKGYYGEALGIFTLSEEKSGEVLQKAAYSCQKLGRYAEALSLYQKAELYEVNKIWNLKKIALCYRNLKLPEEALKVYKTLDSLEPDSPGILYAMGYCQSETGKVQEALNTFFKIEYLSPGNKKVWRPIAWCSFLAGKTAQAEKYYHKLMEAQPDKYDLLNMGHVQWVAGKRESALEYYLLSIRTGGFQEAEFMTVFEEDLHFLLERGIDPLELPILLDQLRYLLEA